MIQVNGMKNIIIQVTYILKIPMVNVVLASYIERKCFLKRNLATMLPLKSKLFRKFQNFNPIGGSIKILKIDEFSKISIKDIWKKLKHFTRWKQWAALRKLFSQHPPNNLASYISGRTKIFLHKFTGLYRHLRWRETFDFENAVFGNLKMVQCKCSIWPRKRFAEKFVKWVRFLALLWE